MEIEFVHPKNFEVTIKKRQAYRTNVRNLNAVIAYIVKKAKELEEEPEE